MADRAPSPLPAALEDRVVVADGAMATVVRSVEQALVDFAGHEGGHEIPHVTGPDVVRGVRRACPEVVETDTSGADLPNPADRGDRSRARTARN